MNFEQGYFKDSTISNYADYTAKRFDTLCDDLCALGIQPEHTIVDFGCALGGLLAEFKARGYHNIYGTDISWWAVKEGRRIFGLSETELQHLNYTLLEMKADWLFALDVFEHIGMTELYNILDTLNCKRLVLRVPVSAVEGEPYVLSVSRNDKTHIQCHTKEWWENLMWPWKLEQHIVGEAIYDSPGVLAAVFKCNEP